MHFISTQGGSPPATLAEALRLGLAPDGGLYVPERLEPLPREFFDGLPGRPWSETTTRVARHLLGPAFDPMGLEGAVLDRLVTEALDFPIPLVRVEERLHVLELFHGPTLAFKDVGARFLARLLAVTQEDHGKGGEPATVLVATSGDTGGAVAQAFHGVEGTRVVILYPHGKVTVLQERQFTTLGGNVHAFAVDGTFDDCQRLVKACFANAGLHRRLRLTSANSINIGRLLPQIFYYFHAVAQLPADTKPLFVTPSGNFGNLTAGLLAKALGLDASFVAATNANDVVPSYLETGLFEPRPSLRTVSNAMDVGNPSNFDRILHLYDGDIDALRRDLVGRRYDDDATCQAIRDVDAEHGYLLDPHTAVGYLAAKDVLPGRSADTVAVVLGTAHPAKFRETVEPAIGREIHIPSALSERLDLDVKSVPLDNDLEALEAALGALD